VAKDPEVERRRGRNIGVGCLTAIGGWFSGAMVGVLVSKAVAFLTQAPSCPQIPTCNWHVYALVGGVIGVLTLPTVTLMRLRRGDAVADISERG
jgi:hypothetical protein